MKAALVPFEAEKMRSACTLWLNDDDALGALTGIGPEEFRDMFAYGVRTTEAFDKVSFDASDRKTLFAEGYGGRGTGRNMGGARVGNLGNYQIKGVGRNPMAGHYDGSVDEFFHWYGGFGLYEAIAEVINSEVFGRILPHGTVKCYGLILSGPDTSFFPLGEPDAKPSFGAMVVRDIVLRPAHFMRARWIETDGSLSRRLSNDVERTRSVCKEFTAAFDTPSEFVGHIADCLRNSAEQAAFACIFRIAHGGLTPSNIALDGRWLDMGLATFMSSRADYVVQPAMPTFTEEPLALSGFFSELVDNCAKYAGWDLSPAPLKRFYEDQFKAFSLYYVPTAFGIRPDLFDVDAAMSARRSLLSYLNAAACSGLKKTMEPPRHFDAEDPVFASVRKVLFGATRPNYEFRSTATDATTHEAIMALSEIMGLTTSGMNNREAQIQRIWFCLTALKRLHFASFFYRARLIGQAAAVVQGARMEAVSEMIDEWRQAAAWVFDWSLERLVLFRGQDLEVAYDRSDRILVQDAGAPTVFERADGYAGLVEMIHNVLRPKLSVEAIDSIHPVDRYDFAGGLCALVEFIIGLEQPNGL